MTHTWMQKVVWYTTSRPSEHCTLYKSYEALYRGYFLVNKKTAWGTMVHTGTLGHRQPGLVYVSYAGVVFWYINGDLYRIWVVYLGIHWHQYQASGAL